jgi:hypothetical protein
VLEIVLSGEISMLRPPSAMGGQTGPLNDDDLNSFVDALVRHLASFDRAALAAAKAQINRFGTPTATEFQSSNDMFFSTLA